MKAFLRLLVFAVLIVTAVVLWKKYRSAPAPTTSAVVKTETRKLDLAPRTWTNHDGRTFEGSLVSVKNSQVIIRRTTDSVYFQIPVVSLSPENQLFLKQQAAISEETDEGFIEQVPGVYTLSRKLDIKGSLVRVPDSALVGGWRNDRVNPMYWLLLSTKLHGTDSGSLWVRVDEKTFRAHEEGSLVTQANLLNFSDGKGNFSDSLPWPRPHLTVIEAQYGPNSRAINVTQKLMRLVSQGVLPMEISPAIFQLEPHVPEAWELTVAWRTADGEVRRTLRDGSVLTWP